MPVQHSATTYFAAKSVVQVQAEYLGRWGSEVSAIVLAKLF